MIDDEALKLLLNGDAPIVIGDGISGLAATIALTTSFKNVVLIRLRNQPKKYCHAHLVLGGAFSAYQLLKDNDVPVKFIDAQKSVKLKSLFGWFPRRRSGIKIFKNSIIGLYTLLENQVLSNTAVTKYMIDEVDLAAIVKNAKSQKSRIVLLASGFTGKTTSSVLSCLRGHQLNRSLNPAPDTFYASFKLKFDTKLKIPWSTYVIDLEIDGRRGVIASFSNDDTLIISAVHKLSGLIVNNRSSLINFLEVIKAADLLRVLS